jgi:hypothetical protein
MEIITGDELTPSTLASILTAGISAVVTFLLYRMTDISAWVQHDDCPPSASSPNPVNEPGTTSTGHRRFAKTALRWWAIQATPLARA